MYLEPNYKQKNKYTAGDDQSGDEPNSPQQEQDEQNSKQDQQIEFAGSVTPMTGKHAIHCLTIIGQIEGHYILAAQNKTTKYEHVIPQLVAVEQDPRIEGLLMILNTVGGDVEAGLAIAELVSGMSKPTVSIVLGGGHSIGVPLACSATRSFIVPSATMTIHPVRMNGIVLGVPQTLSYFERMQDRIIDFVTTNSNMPPDRFRRLMMNTQELVMDVGTMLDGKDAVKEGLIDSLGGLADAIECLYSLIEERRAADAQQDQANPPTKQDNPNPPTEDKPLAKDKKQPIKEKTDKKLTKTPKATGKPKKVKPRQE